jgi:hypothetical protein
MKPRTPAQQAASRANGAKSRGPITPRGKHHSALNSTRHGLLCQTVVLPEESKHRFMTIVRDLFAEHTPQTPTEPLLVETIRVKGRPGRDTQTPFSHPRTLLGISLDFDPGKPFGFACGRSFA